MTRFISLVLLAAVSILGGCASSLSGDAYERGAARTVHEVQMATVEHVREVQIEGTKTGIGTAAGAAMGNVAGRGKDGGTVKGAVGGIAGAVVGGMIGAAAEEGLTRRKGIEITLKLDDGRLIAVTQEADEEFKVGDRVRILTGRGVTRVSH